MRQWLGIIRSRRSLDGCKLALFVFLKKEGEREGKGKVQELGLLKRKKKGALRLGCREEKEGWDVLESVGWGSAGNKVSVWVCPVEYSFQGNPSVLRSPSLAASLAGV